MARNADLTTCNDAELKEAEFYLYDTDNSGTISESEFWAQYACMQCSYSFGGGRMVPFASLA